MLMRVYLLFLFLFSAISSGFSQARLILNNGGIVNITNNAFVVIDNPNPTAISRNTSGHIISEGEFNRVKWNIGTTAGTYVVPFGIGTSEYLPVALTTSGAVGASGSLTFATYGGNWINTGYLPTGITNFVNNLGLNNSAYVIDRFWRIEPNAYTTKPGLANLIFTYRDIEHSVANNAISESSLTAQRYNTGTNEWDDFLPLTSVNTLANTATVASLPANQLYAWWTLVQNTSILPVELISFNAKCNGNNVEIYWTTASESNNDYFEIERSMDGLNFSLMTRVSTVNGNSSQPQQYSSIDENPLSGKSYYRLKQTDKDGKFTYSSLVIVTCKDAGNTTPVVSLFPSPAIDVLTVDIKGMPGKKSLLVYDLLGQVVLNKVLLDESNDTRQYLDIGALSNATYIIRIDAADELKQIMKFVKTNIKP